MKHKLLAEALGALLLATAVIGSGIMAERRADGSAAIALLANAGATAAALAVLIAVLGPICGAHFNPVVSLIAAVRGELPPTQVAGYVFAQVRNKANRIGDHRSRISTSRYTEISVPAQSSPRMTARIR
jgi:glycerol uptake facilitator-like aquaporin